jgi:hypothetical protein
MLSNIHLLPIISFIKWIHIFLRYKPNSHHKILSQITKNNFFSVDSETFRAWQLGNFRLWYAFTQQGKSLEHFQNTQLVKLLTVPVLDTLNN